MNDFNNDCGAVNSSSIKCGLMDSNNSMNYTTNAASPFYMGGQDINNELSPSNTIRGLSPDENSAKVHQIHLTKKEKKVIKITAIVVLVLTGIMSLLLGLERGLGFFGSLLPLLLFGVFMPYVFVKDIYLSIKQKRREKKNKHKQLELPL